MATNGNHTISTLDAIIERNSRNIAEEDRLTMERMRREMPNYFAITDQTGTVFGPCDAPLAHWSNEELAAITSVLSGYLARIGEELERRFP
jgi:hypothetical protein